MMVKIKKVEMIVKNWLTEIKYKQNLFHKIMENQRIIFFNYFNYC